MIQYLPVWERLLLVLGFVLFFAGEAQAQTVCPPATITCPAYTLCSTWNIPTTRKGGAVLPATELSAFEISLGSALIGRVTGDKTSYNYAIPDDTTLAAGSLLSFVAVDTGGQKSDPNSCTLAKAYSGAKSIPAPPGNVRVQ